MYVLLNTETQPYTFTDKLGDHVHPVLTGPFDFNHKITCPTCIDRLRAQRVELCEKYGFATWPFPKDYIDA